MMTIKAKGLMMSNEAQCDKRKLLNKIRAKKNSFNSAQKSKFFSTLRHNAERVSAKKKNKKHFRDEKNGINLAAAHS